MGFLHSFSRAARMAAGAALALACGMAPAAGDVPPSLASGIEGQVRELALGGAPPAGGGITRVEIEVGQLDSRLRLAPCEQVKPYLLSNTRLWGRTRIGLRCTLGPSRWNVFLPITVKVYGQALTATTPLAVGSVVAASDVAQAEVDLAEDRSPALRDTKLAVGRTLSRAINAGQSLRQSHLKARQWFAAGDTVKIVAMGRGFSVAGEGRALTPGMEGKAARVQTESGRVLTGHPNGERRMQLTL